MKTNTETPVTNLSMASCIKAITQSLVLGRKALHLELAVCMAILGTLGEKKNVLAVYQKSGYDCADPTSRHYKTVNRRINGAVALFEKIGQKQVKAWIGDLKDGKLIEAVGNGLDTYKFDSMDAVLEFVGKDSNKGRAKRAGKEGTPIKTRAKAAKPDVPMIKFNAGKLHIALPESASPVDMVRLAAKILDCARKKEQLELKAGVASISSVENPVPVPSALH